MNQFSIKTVVLSLLAITIFFATILLYVQEIQWFQNTLNVRNLVGLGLTIGLIIGLTIGHFFAKKENDLVNRMRLYSLFSVLSMILMPLVFSLTNRLLSLQSYEQKKVELYDKKAFIQDLGIIENQDLSPDGYFYFVVIEGELIRLKSKTDLFPNAKKGEQVALKIKEGILGFRVVDF